MGIFSIADFVDKVATFGYMDTLGKLAKITIRKDEASIAKDWTMAILGMVGPPIGADMTKLIQVRNQHPSPLDVARCSTGA